MAGKSEDLGNRLNAVLPSSDMDFIRSYADRKEITLTEAARRAISSLRFIDSTQERDAVVCVREDESVRDVFFYM